ncbi:sterol desaturase family protein [Novosphingobium sp. BW1]|uniref:sterol desaturase family protein n=1 Tax=Novosphingobium sp. BW1 TaxID=2592621 RepID=UPI0011DEFBC4|nr:sterol desaturase family protein [Novosphingobium sp. BW1]TYC91669.1 fatty acid hydroxylase [Novosphingobium sp. BW1]
MNKGPVSNHTRLRLFQNAWLERLTVVSAFWFGLTWAVLLPLIGLAGWGAVGPLTGLGLVALGLAVWSLFEYAMHRYLFHWQTQIAPIRWVVFLIHGNHHEQPDDRLRNLMPPILSIPIALCVWGVFALVMGRASAWPFLGFMMGYVAYDLVHYACHQWPMRGRLGQALKRHHMRHHHIDKHANYAITAIFWDRVFGSDVRSLKR